MSVHQIKEQIDSGKRVVTVCGETLARVPAFLDGVVSAWASDVTCRKCKRAPIDTVVDGQGVLV